MGLIASLDLISILKASAVMEATQSQVWKEKMRGERCVCEMVVQVGLNAYGQEKGN